MRRDHERDADGRIAKRFEEFYGRMDTAELVPVERSDKYVGSAFVKVGPPKVDRPDAIAKPRSLSWKDSGLESLVKSVDSRTFRCDSFA